MSCGCKPKTGPEFDPDFEGPSCEDLERFNSDVATCPECDADLYSDSTICPSCGHAIIELKSGAKLPPPLIAGIAVVALIAFIFVFVF